MFSAMAITLGVMLVFLLSFLNSSKKVYMQHDLNMIDSIATKICKFFSLVIILGKEKLHFVIKASSLQTFLQRTRDF